MRKTITEFWKYFLIALLFYILHCAQIENVHFFALAMLVTLIKIGLKPVILAILFVLSGYFVAFDLHGVWFNTLSASTVLICVYILNWLKKPLGNFTLGVIFVFANLSKIVMCVINPELRLSTFLELSLGIILLYCFLYVLTNLKTRGLRKKYSNEEMLFIGVAVFSVAVGLVNCVFPSIFYVSFALCSLLIVYSFSSSATLAFAIMFGLGGAVSFENFMLLSTCVAVASVICVVNCDKKILMLCGEILSFILFSLYFDTFFTTEILLSFLAGGLVFLFLPQKVLNAFSSFIVDENEYVATKVVVNQTREEFKKNLINLSDVLWDMKNIYYNIAKSGNLADELNCVALEVKKRVCLSCENRCNNCSSLENIKELLNLALAREKISIIDTPPNLYAGCVNLNLLITSINEISKSYRKKTDDINKKKNTSLLLSSLCGDVSKIVHESAIAFDEKVAFDTKIEQRIKDNLFSQGINCVDVVAFLKNNRLERIILTLPKQTDLTIIRRVLYDTTHTSFDEGEAVDGAKLGFISVTYYKSSRFDVIYGCYGGIKPNSEVSGDSFSVTKLNRKNVLFAISDGMGSGQKAHKISSQTLDVLEDFLCLGLDSEFSVENVNKMFLNRGEEIFSAIDVGVINLETGMTNILKLGSAVSYIIRDKDLIKLESKSMPLGMLKEMHSTPLTTILADGDFLVLFSDGVVDSFPSEQVLEQELRSISCLNPHTIAKIIVDKALEFSKDYAKDDMTALVIRIVKNL